MAKRSLAVRLIALALVQLVLFVSTALAILFATAPDEPGRPDEIGPATLARIARADDAGLARLLDELQEERIEASIYDASRRLVASNVDPALAIPERPPHETPPPPRPEGPPRRRLLVRVEVHGGEGLLVARGVHGEPPGLAGPLLSLLSGIVILVVGALLTARWIVRPIDRLARTARALGAGDLGARSRLDRDDEIGALGDRFDEMAERIERLLATEKELLANIAHELRTPLSRIGVALDLAAEGDAAAARTALTEISVDVEELEQIIDDVLTAMRFEVAGAARLPLRREVIAPEAIAEAAAARSRARHPARPLALAIAPDLPAIDVDRVLVRRVIDNLLENAHKYTPDPDAPLELAAASSSGAVTFTVRDRGIGIAADDLPRVFTAFFRSDRSRSRESGGVGLGLTLAKRITEAHGGAIAVASELEQGTTVTVSFPIATTAHTERG